MKSAMIKPAAIIALCILGITSSFAQSKSFQTLRNHFIDNEDVHAFSIGGFWCRAAMSMVADEGDELLNDMMDDIDHIRLIVIPKADFGKQNLTLGGFKKYLAKDAFEEMMSVRDKGDHVSIFMREDSNKKNRYFVLVEESTEVVAIEMKGYIDPELFKNENNKITFNK
ncbi:MAG: hypothetical protein DI538_01570 [Azospira oryzae]|jgi:hypothetical protein|nr:hypothetical protein [Cytophaga sp.]PZR41324.1 MAG: hypothetical protein DI538_01570 [Azospira oryzae]